MKTGIIYYSWTGRNERLSKLVCEKLKLERTKITEVNTRKRMTVAWDLTFSRVPKVKPNPDIMDKYDLVILFAPVWMGGAATPVRKFLKHIKKTKKRYAFISLSSGADESNPNLLKSVTNSAGHKPELLMDMHAADVIKSKVSREELQNFKLSDEDYNVFTNRAVEALRGIMDKE